VPVLHPRRVAAPEEGELPLVDTAVVGVEVGLGVDVGVDVGVAVPLTTTTVIGVVVPLTTMGVGVAVPLTTATVGITSVAVEEGVTSGRTGKVKLTVP